MSPIEVYTPKYRLIIGLLVSIGFVGISIDAFNSHAGQLGLKDALGLFLGITFFGIAAVISLFRIIYHKPTLVIDDTGISHKHQSSLGTVPWAEISKIRIVSFKGQKMLAVCVDDPSKYLYQSNPFMRLLIRLNQFIIRIPAITVIPRINLSVTKDALISEVNKHLRAGVTVQQ